MTLFHSFLCLSNIPLSACITHFFLHSSAHGYLGYFHVLVLGLLTEVKEESEKAGLKLNTEKKISHETQSHHFMANKWGNNDWLYFFWLGKRFGAFEL